MGSLAHRLLPVRVVATGDRKAIVLLVLASLLPALQRCLGAAGPAPGGIAPVTGIDELLPLFSSAFLLLGVIPLLTVLLLFREEPRAYGLRIGDWRQGLAAVAVLAPIISMALLLPASRTQEMRGAYPLDLEAVSSRLALIRLEAARGILFYTAWEFFFRGFILFGLRDRVGTPLAVCIQTIPSSLWHIGLPAGELAFSILGGIVFGVLAVRTRSIIWPFLLHFLIGVSLDLWIVALP